MKFQYTTRGLLKIFVFFAIILFGINYLRSVDWENEEIVRFEIPQHQFTLVVTKERFPDYYVASISYKILGPDKFRTQINSFELTNLMENQTTTDHYDIRIYEPESLVVFYNKRMGVKDNTITLEEINVIIDLKTGVQLLPKNNQEILPHASKQLTRESRHVVNSNDHSLWKRILQINLNRE